VNVAVRQCSTPRYHGPEKTVYSVANADAVMLGCWVSSTNRTFPPPAWRRQWWMPVMISTHSMGFDAALCLGFRVDRRGCVIGPIELGIGPGPDILLLRKLLVSAIW
jgi:hypothetical protein